MLTLRYFARIRERLGLDHETFSSEATTVRALIAQLAERGEPWSAIFIPSEMLRVAVNQEMVGFDTPIGPDDEVAFFPPVTGG